MCNICATWDGAGITTTEYELYPVRFTARCVGGTTLSFLVDLIRDATFGDPLWAGEGPRYSTGPWARASIWYRLRETVHTR